MTQKSDKKSSHVLIKTLRSRIRRLEQFYIVLDGSYGISLPDDNLRNTMIILIEEISRLFEELEQSLSSKKELEKIKADYNRMVKRWEGFIKDKRNQNKDGKLERAKRIFDRFRS